MLEIYHIQMEVFIMKKEREQLSITKQYAIRYFINGIAWLLFSIFNLSDNKAFRIIGSIFMLFAAICTLISLLPNREPDDEMSLQHIRKAKSASLDVTVILLMAIGVCSFLPNRNISYRYVYGFIVALSQITAGLLFHLFEKGGH
jgi:hypothetical protein